jgi:hypothetical protein
MSEQQKLKVMRLRDIISILFIALFVQVSGQINGKAKHLVGTWEYESGGGVEVWKLEGDQLIGYGYRTSKTGDTVKVEDLKISKVNKNLVYSLSTKQQTETGIKVNNYKFVGNKNRLYFENIDDEIPASFKYSFGLFSRSKLKIVIRYSGRDKPLKLKLRKKA